MLKPLPTKAATPAFTFFVGSGLKRIVVILPGWPWKIWDERGIPPATLYGAAEGMQTGRIRGGDSAGQDAGRKGRPA